MASEVKSNIYSPYTTAGLTINGTTVTFAGVILSSSGTAAAPGMAFSSEPGLGFYRISTSVMGVGLNSAGRIMLAAGSSSGQIWAFDSNAAGAGVGGLYFSTTPGSVGSADAAIVRDASNTIALKNNANAQSFRVYNTFTNSSNYERAVLDWSTATNELTIGTQFAGTGISRTINFVRGGTKIFDFQSNTLRMSQDITFATNNANDIGATASRPRTIYSGTSVITPVVDAATSVTAPALVGSTSVTTPNAIVGGDSITGVASQVQVDAGTNSTEVLVPSLNRITLGTPVATTSGTSFDFTGIPAGTRRIVVNFVGISGNGTSPYMVQLGDSGGIETTGYLGGTSNISSVVSSVNFTTGFGMAQGVDANVVLHGSMTITLADSSTNTWVASGTFGFSNTGVTSVIGYSKSLSAVLDRIRITHQNGTDTFDAGKINIVYER